MCYTYDKSKGRDTREPQTRLVPPPKKLGRVTLISKYFTQIRQKERMLHFSSIQIYQVTSKSVHYPT